MKWNHLPLPGGLAAQHPDLLDGFSVIFSERNQHEAEERAKQEAKSKRPSSSKVAGRRRG